MLSTLATLASAGMLAMASLLGWNHQGRRQQRERRRGLTTQLQIGLDLLQGIQQHRGLGGQAGADATARRLALRQRLEPLWTIWAAPDQHVQWQHIRETPADLDAHCLLIEALLGHWRHRELQLRVLEPARPSLIKRCQEIEHLGLIRGLGVRVARHARCPLELQVRLHYLCERLHEAEREPHLDEALARLRRDLLDAEHRSLTPEACFALLTPLIDARLERLRALL